MELLVESQGKEDKPGARSIWPGGSTVIDTLSDWKHGTIQNSQLSLLGAPMVGLIKETASSSSFPCRNICILSTCHDIIPEMSFS